MEEKKLLIKYIKIILNIGISLTGILLLLWLGPKFLSFFMPFVIGWIIALIANPLVRFFERRLKIVRKHSSAIIVICVIGGIIVGGYFLIVKIGTEIWNFRYALPDLYTALEEELQYIMGKFSSIFVMLPEETRQSITQIGNSLNEYIGAAIQSIAPPTISAVGNATKNIPNVLIQVIMTILSSYFFIADRDKLMIYIQKITPDSIEKNFSIIYKHFKNVVGGYFKAQFRIMGVVALILFLGFLILRVDYALLLALLIAFLDFLPFFGTGTALIPWAAVKLLAGDYRYALGLLVIYLVSQLIRQLIQPKIVGDSMGLNPLMTLIFMYIGFKLQGIAGMILAVPIGLIIIKLFEAGAFDDIINGVKEIVNDINKFRKSP